MEKKLDEQIQELAFRRMLDIDISEELNALIQKHGSIAIERAIAGNGLTTVFIRSIMEQWEI